MPIYITAIIKSQPAHVQEVKSVLENLVTESRKETACLQYDLHQGIEDPNLFVFYEIWADERGLAQHNAQPYMLNLARLAGDKLAEKPLVYLTTKL